MNIEFSDIVSQDYLLITGICSIAIILCFIFFIKEKLNKKDNPLPLTFSAILLLVTGLVFGMGYYDSSRSKMYFDRFQAFYESSVNQKDFWIKSELEELAASGTINGLFVSNVNNGSNPYITMLKKHFPSDNYNVQDFDALRALKLKIKDCVPKEDRKKYLKSLSELPVSKHTLYRIRNEISILYSETCEPS